MSIYKPDITFRVSILRTLNRVNGQGYILSLLSSYLKILVRSNRVGVSHTPRRRQEFSMGYLDSY